MKKTAWFSIGAVLLVACVLLVLHMSSPRIRALRLRERVQEGPISLAIERMELLRSPLDLVTLDGGKILTFAVEATVENGTSDKTIREVGMYGYSLAGWGAHKKLKRLPFSTSSSASVTLLPRQRRTLTFQVTSTKQSEVIIGLVVVPTSGEGFAAGPYRISVAK